MRRLSLIIVFLWGSVNLFAQTAAIDSIEVFINNDPGYGNGFMVFKGQPADSIINEFIDVLGSALPVGFHTLGVRVKSNYIKDANDTISFTTDEFYRWSITEYRSFYVSSVSSTIIANIDSIEYFFDDDPGIGSGLGISIIENDSIDIAQALAADTLSPGFHSLGMRVRDVDGNWSISEFRSFIVSSTGAVTIALIDSAEYFFDTDPGIGNGIGIPITPNDSIDITLALASDTLSPGFHILGIRVRDENGTWGIPEYRSFVVSSTGSVIIANIDSIEYFLDDDPGVGSGIGISITENDSIDITQALAADTLSPGFHSLGMRVRDVNGNWSVSEYRSFIVSSTGAVTIANIDSVEYFFDSDPGVGNGIVISVTANDSINITQALASDTLSPGFHILGIRARDENGNWSLPEFRSFVVSQTNLLTVSPIVEIEYFYDDDPGYGSGSLVFSGSQDSVELNLNIPPPPVAGLHTLTVRAKDTDGNWGIPEIREIYSLDPGRELDSLALVLMYNNTNGAAWPSQNNWLSGNLDTWYGVSTFATRVDSLNLDANSLAGVLPIEFGYITKMRSFTLSNNLLRDSIPYNISSLMTSLEYVDISNNQLNGLPDLSGIGSMQILLADSNRFDFGDLESNAAISNFTYAPQDPVTQPIDTFVEPGEVISLDVAMGGTNTYQWYKDSLIIGGANANSFFLTPVTPTDSGLYYCLIDNALLPLLTLSTDYYHVLFSSRTTDSLALVSLYNSTDGANWTTNTNWLAGGLDTWIGLTLDSINVRQLRLPSNNLVGNIPNDIYYLDSLNLMDLSGNSIIGYIPGSIVDMNLLDTLSLQNNDLDSLPNMVIAPMLNNVDISGNMVHFGDLEINLGISNFTYAPQDSLGSYEYILADAGDPFSMNAKVRGFNNTYQWFKNGIAEAGQTNADLNIVAVAFADEGFYSAEVNNTLVNGLTLYTAARELRVSSLERDSVALVKMYETTGGDNWVDKTGWDSSNRGTLDTWIGVVITTNRISEVNLPGNNLSGDITDKIRDITQLEVFDVSGNKLKKIPYMGTLTQIITLDVSNNQLGFEFLEPNVSIGAAFIYDPQDSLDVNTADTIFVGTSHSFTAGSYSTNNSYQWSFNEADITGATDTSYQITTMERDSMGLYSAKISNSVITGMDIYTKPVRLLAKASIAGNVTEGGTAVTAGEVRLFQIKPTGGFDTTNIAAIANDGTYLIPNVILDDYMLVADADDVSYADLVPTYYGNTIYWEEADTIPLINDITQIDVPFWVEPVETTGLGSIFGIVEADLEDTGGRIFGRRAVAKATITIKKVTGGQRKLKTMEDEVVAVTYSDENGQFVMPKLEAGDYIFNVQYPGIPMSESTNTLITIGEEQANRDVEVLATVTLDGIFIETFITGLSGELVRAFKIYPNPTSLSVTIENTEFRGELSKIILLDVNGRIVLSQPVILYERKNLDVSTLKNGVYILKILNKHDEPKGEARIIVNR